MARFLSKMLLAALLLILSYQKCAADHVMGADISYTWQGGTSYLVTVYAYSDCNGIPLSGQGLEITAVGGQTVSLIGNVCCGEDITPVCERSCDRCIDPN